LAYRNIIHYGREHSGHGFHILVVKAGKEEISPLGLAREVSGQRLGTLTIMGNIDENLATSNHVLGEPSRPVNTSETPGDRFGLEPGEETGGFSASRESKSKVDIRDLMVTHERGGHLEGRVIPREEKTANVLGRDLDQLGSRYRVWRSQRLNELGCEAGPDHSLVS
jgi:hypothetical protein